MSELLTSLGKEYATLRDKKYHFQENLKEVNAEMRKVEEQMLSLMKDNEMPKFKLDDIGTFYKSETVVGHLKDWDKFWKYVQDEQADFLLERRVKSTAFREVLQSGEEVPGVEPFTRVTIGLTKR